MSRYIIIFSLFLINIASGQYIYQPETYKLSPQNFKSFTNEKFQIDRVYSVIPNKSKYPISNFITDILVSGDTVWFGTGSGMMRSTDRFKSFEIYYGIHPFGEEDIAGITLFENIIVASTAISQEISGDNIPVGTGIKVSTDYGINWNSYPQPLDANSDTNITYGSNVLYALPVVVRQQNLAYDVAVTKDSNITTIWIASFAGGLRKSTDFGVIWERVLLPPDNLDSIYIGGTGYTFGLNPRDNLNHRVFSVEGYGKVIYAGTANGINKSTDGGKSWRKYNFQNSGSGQNRVSGNFVVNLHIQRYSGKEIIWGATKKAEDNNEVNAFSYSSNGGQNWAYTLKDVPPNGISSKDSITYAESNEGLWRCRFGLFDWTKPSLIYDEETKDVLRTDFFYCGNNVGDTLYFGSADGLIRTIETGFPWTSKWKIYRAQQFINLNSDLKTYAAPNPFSPDDEVVRIFYKTGKNYSKITIKIFDFGMNPVRTLIQNAVRTSPDELFTAWDGKNDNGYQVANGVYFYRIEIDDSDKNWGKIIVLQ